MGEKVKRNGVETEQRLIDVAIKLIRQNGVLAGRNLHEVAEGAGVNRGNTYHYFGSRRELLRAAIGQCFESMAKVLVNRHDQGAPFIDRRLRPFQGSGTVQDSQVRAIPVVDGDDDVDPMPRHEELLSPLRRDVIDGHIDPRHDLDGRVAEIIRVWLEAMKQPPGES